MLNRKTWAWVVLAMGLLVCLIGDGGGGTLAQEGGQAGAQAAVTPLLQYQGRLSDPATGEAVADGSYTMVLRLYDVETGGTPLWQESEDVPVQGGLFSTVLGDVTALDQALFNGQALWLGIKVGADAEAAPRQQITPVAYALSLVPGALVQGDSAPVLHVKHSGGGQALWVSGNLVVNGNLVGGSHNHDGRYVNVSGPGQIEGSSSSAMLTVDQNGSGDGGIFSSITGNALVAAGDAQVTGDLAVGGSLSAPRAQRISFPAHALNFDPGTIIQETGTGLLWQANYAQVAYLTVARPADWDGTSDVVMHLYFLPTTSTSGNVKFFVRPRAYNPGDLFGDVASLSDAAVPVSQANVVQDQTIAIPASRFGSKELWVITIQRQATGSSYADDVILVSVALSFTAAR